MREFIREYSCKLASISGEQHGRTFSSSTADGINYLTDGLIQDTNSDLTHGLMLTGVGAAVFSLKNSEWLIVFLVLIVVILIFWSFGQKKEAVRFIEGREKCTTTPILSV